MKEKSTPSRRRDIKSDEKKKDEAEGDTSHSLHHDDPSKKHTIEELILCQICKEVIVDEHRMCPH